MTISKTSKTPVSASCTSHLTPSYLTETKKDPLMNIRDRNVPIEDHGDELSVDGHRVRISSFVVGIDPQKFDDALKAPDVISKIKELEQVYHDKTVIVGVDRLDHAKGLIQKLAGYELLLNEHPELKKKITLIQLVVPSREDVKEYQELQTELSTTIGRICGEHSKFRFACLAVFFFPYFKS